jgi:hypothetical protein
MHWDRFGDMVGGTLEVWCVKPPTGTDPGVFGPSGRTLDLTSKAITGAYTQCN